MMQKALPSLHSLQRTSLRHNALTGFMYGNRENLDFGADIQSRFFYAHAPKLKFAELCIFYVSALLLHRIMLK